MLYSEVTQFSTHCRRSL